MQRPLPWRAPVVAAAALAVVAAHGCDDGDAPSSPPPTSFTTGPGGLTPAGPGGGAGMGGAGGAEIPEGGQAPVYLGLSANPLSEQSEPTPSEALLAELTAFAAGVRSIHVEARFGSLDSAAVAALAERLAQYTARDLRVVLTLLIVDGAAAHRPEGMEGVPWDDAALSVALDGELDAVFDAAGEHLDAVVFARALDVYLEEHPGEGGALLGLVAAAVDQVHERAPAILTGVGLRPSADPPPRYDEAAALGNALALSYLPGAGAAALPSDTSPAHDLDAMIALAGERPIILHALGFPSAPTLGSAPELQAQRLDAFMSALDARRSAFPLVNVVQLHDVPQPACEALLAAQGLLPDDPYGDYVCTTGLRDTTGAPKPAWQTFIQASGRFAGP
jgi:hypothetical protein